MGRPRQGPLHRHGGDDAFDARGIDVFDSAWALFEGVVVFGGYSELPVVNLGLGFIRALAVVAVSFAAVDIGKSYPQDAENGGLAGVAVRVGRRRSL